ncbi:MAG: hypothetical protein MAG795_00494 [Candidatus Woesearchaeota archaeon]|nr:hypothetical protein [Candidatus Woesearchaeota archaeon]
MISTALKHYKGKEIQEAIVRAAKDKEIATRYGNRGFGKRPDILQYPRDVFESAKKNIFYQLHFVLVVELQIKYQLELV